MSEGKATLFQRVVGIYTPSIQSCEKPFSALDKVLLYAKGVAAGPAAPLGSEYLDVAMQAISAVSGTTADFDKRDKYGR